MPHLDGLSQSERRRSSIQRPQAGSGMTDQITRYAEAAYALVVAGAAMLWPPLALIVAAGYLVGLAVVVDRRTPPVETP